MTDQIKIQPGSNDWSIITVMADDGIAEASALRKAAVGEHRLGHYMLVIDFTHVDSIDASVISVLLFINKQCARHKGALRLVLQDEQERLTEQLHATEVTRSLQTFWSLQAATSSEP